jgi:hypothetical protein
MSLFLKFLEISPKAYFRVFTVNRPRFRIISYVSILVASSIEDSDSTIITNFTTKFVPKNTGRSLVWYLVQFIFFGGKTKYQTGGFWKALHFLDQINHLIPKQTRLVLSFRCKYLCGRSKYNNNIYIFVFMATLSVDMNMFRIVKTFNTNIIISFLFVQ